jgi:hypothetical protein
MRVVPRSVRLDATRFRCHRHPPIVAMIKPSEPSAARILISHGRAVVGDGGDEE